MQPLLRYSFKDFPLAKWALLSVTWTFLFPAPGRNSPMSCSRKEQWSCWQEHLFDPPQAPFQPDMKQPPRRRAKGQYCTSATIISVIHTALTIVSIGLRHPFSWESDVQEDIDPICCHIISLCGWGSSAVTPRVFSAGSVQQSLNQPTGICKTWAEDLRGTRKQTKPSV